LKTISRPTMSR